MQGENFVVDSERGQNRTNREQLVNRHALRSKVAAKWYLLAVKKQYSDIYASISAIAADCCVPNLSRDNQGENEVLASDN